MRPSRIVSAGVIAALLVTAAAVWPSWSTTAPGRGAALLLTRSPAIVLALIAVYALVTIVTTAGGLIAAAVDLRRALGRSDATSQSAAALEWLADIDATAFRPLVASAAAAASNAPRRKAPTLLDIRFDPHAARTETAHLYYILLARTHSLGALVGLAALAALGFAQAQGAVPFVAPIPAGPAVVVLVGLLLLVLLGRCAIDVTVDPLIDGLSQLPWEPAEADRLRQAAALLEAARIDAVRSSQREAGIASDMPERLALAFEDSTRALTEAGTRLSAAADTLGAATRFSASTTEAILRETRSIAQHAAATGDDSVARLAALQAAIEALTAACEHGMAEEQVAGWIEQEQQALAGAVERLSAAADAIAVAARSSIDALADAVRDGLASLQSRSEPGEAEAAALQAAIQALAAELQQFTAVVNAAKQASGAAGPVTAPVELARELRELLQEM